MTEIRSEISTTGKGPKGEVVCETESATYRIPVFCQNGTNELFLGSAQRTVKIRGWSIRARGDESNVSEVKLLNELRDRIYAEAAAMMDRREEELNATGTS